MLYTCENHDSIVVYEGNYGSTKCPSCHLDDEKTTLELEVGELKDRIEELEGDIKSLEEAATAHSEEPNA